jgi:hypothetical protein
MKTTIKPKLCLRWRSESGRGYCRRRDAYYATAKHRIRRCLEARLESGRLSVIDDEVGGYDLAGQYFSHEYVDSLETGARVKQFDTERFVALAKRYAAKLMVHDSIAAEE